MSKTKVLTLSILIILVLAPYAYARTESFTLATDIVKRFDKETKTLLPKTLSKEEKSTFTKIIKENRKETFSMIKSLRRSENPSPKRFSRLFRIIDRHTENHIKEVEKLDSLLQGLDKIVLNNMRTQLIELREGLLTELKATSYSEGRPLERNKPDPVIDRSPYEERPGDTRGLYER